MRSAGAVLVRTPDATKVTSASCGVRRLMDGESGLARGDAEVVQPHPDASQSGARSLAHRAVGLPRPTADLVPGDSRPR